MTCHDPRTTVVVITRNRRDGLLRTLRAPAALPERPPVVVVDSASTDGAADAVARHRPEVALLRPGRNPGAVGRDPAVRRAGAGRAGRRRQGLPRVLRERRVVPPEVEARSKALSRVQRLSTARRYVGRGGCRYAAERGCAAAGPFGESAAPARYARFAGTISGTRRHMITVGVEEEFFLVDPVTCLPVPLAEEVRTAAGLEPIVDAAEVQSELLQSQIEVATPICTGLDEVGGHLLRLRHASGDRRGEERLPDRRGGHGPLPRGGAGAGNGERRYLAMRSQARSWSRSSSSAACTSTSGCPTGPPASGSSTGSAPGCRCWWRCRPTRPCGTGATPGSRAGAR